MAETIIYRDASRTIIREVGLGVGPQGPEGDPGPAGNSTGLGYIHTQSTPSTLWVITHSLPFQPNVSVLDSAGNKVGVDVQYMSSTIIHVKPTSAFAGTAYLS